MCHAVLWQILMVLFLLMDFHLHQYFNMKYMALL